MTSDPSYNFDDLRIDANPKRIVVIGAQGDVGSAVCDELGRRHDLIRVGRNSGEINADITDRKSIEAMFDKVGKVDAVITAAGAVRYAPIEDFPEEDFKVGMFSKFLGQANVVMTGIEYMNEGGSFTLTSGITNREPIRCGASAAASNSALEGFAVGSAIDMPRGIRINVVSPGLLAVSAPQFEPYFRGYEKVSSERVGLAYAKCVEGAMTGKIFPVD